jgi:biotin carboxylase
VSWILSLGAGKDQIPLIKAIHHEGFKVAAVDMRADAEGVDLCDAFKAISNRDVDAVLDYAAWIEIEGVMAAGSEVPDVVAIVAHRLGLPGVPVVTGMTIKDKFLQKNVLLAAGVPCTQLWSGDLANDVVVKPRRSSGSRGLRLVPGPGALPDRDHELAEVYQPGPQISTETLVWDGESFMPAFADRHYESFAKEVGVSMPSRFENCRSLCEAISVEAADALWIKRGTIKCDMVLTSGGPKIIECTCRLSGGPLCLLVEQSLGFNYFRQAVRIAAGKEPDWAHMTGRTAKKASVDMQGQPSSWEEADKFIAPIANSSSSVSR